jgi:hypothetical protein
MRQVAKVICRRIGDTENRLLRRRQALNYLMREDKENELPLEDDCLKMISGVTLIVRSMMDSK